jgi:uncharacterized protein YcfL
MKTALAILTAIMLVGCATPERVSGNPRSIVIRNADKFNVAETQAMANRHCRRHGRYAIHRPDSQRDGLVTYECVE